MPNGQEYLNGLDLKEKIKSMGDRELLEYNVEVTYQILCDCADRDIAIKELQNGDKKRGSVSGGISGFITGIVIGVISYFTNRGGT